jgi:hypothetical protein
MRTPAIVEVQIPSERGACLANTILDPQVDLLVFARTPQPLDKHVVAQDCSTLTS